MLLNDIWCKEGHSASLMTHTLELIVPVITQKITEVNLSAFVSSNDHSSCHLRTNSDLDCKKKDKRLVWDENNSFLTSPGMLNVLSSSAP